MGSREHVGDLEVVRQLADYELADSLDRRAHQRLQGADDLMSTSGNVQVRRVDVEPVDGRLATANKDLLRPVRRAARGLQNAQSSYAELCLGTGDHKVDILGAVVSDAESDADRLAHSIAGAIGLDPALQIRRRRGQGRSAQQQQRHSRRCPSVAHHQEALPTVTTEGTGSASPVL